MSDETTTEEAAPAIAEEETTAHADTAELAAEEPPPDYLKIRYDVPLDTDTPIRAAGLWWHDRSTYRLPRAIAEELLTPENLAVQPGFSRA